MNIAQVPMPERPAILDEKIPVLKGLPLSADSAARFAVLKSLDIRILQLGYESKKTEIMESKGRYDTQFETSGTYEQINEQQPSIVQGNRTITGIWDTRISKNLPTGTETEIFHTIQRNSNNSTFSSLNKNYEGHAGITLRQHLLRNTFGLIDRSEVDQVKLDVESFNEETLHDIEKAVYDARQAYWDFAMKTAFYLAEEDAYKLARDFFEITRDHLETGQAEEADYYAAEANLRTRTEELLEAQLEAKMEMNRLKLALSHWGDLIPEDFPRLQQVNYDLDDLMASALTHRRDLHQKILDIESKGIQVSIDKNKRLPVFDAVGTYSNNALDRDQYDSAGEIWGFNHPTYFLGFEMEFSLESRDHKARHKRSKIELEKSLLELKKLEQQIQFEIEDAYHELQINFETAVQADKVEELQSKKLDSEMKLFRVGRSSSKTIIDFQQDVINARKRRIETLTNFEKAKDKLLLAQNQLLDKLGLTGGS